MKIKTVLMIVILVTAAAAGIFIYERLHVSFHTGDDMTAVSVVGGADGPTSVFIAGKTGGKEKVTYEQITMEEAREIFESKQDSSYMIVDVRRPDEFADGHIPGAINIANETIGTDAPEELRDLGQKIYVYCRSGNRSRQAAEKLAAIGYTNIIEFGGIMDWTGEIER